MARTVTYQPDKVKALRMQVIMDSLMVFSDNEKDKKAVAKWSQYRKDLLMKYASRVLPVLQEHSGMDGQPIVISFDNAFTSQAEGDRK
jgi:hypothetical protein